MLAVLLLGATAATSPAQSTAFTYQGQLQYNGAPANGLYDLQFAVFDAVTNGVQISVFVTNVATPVSAGLFTATLDFGAAPFDGSPIWLDVAARTNGNGAFVSLAPRQPITPSPLAIYAATAASAGAVGSIVNTNIAQLSVPNTTVQATGSLTVFNGFIVGVTLLNPGSGYTTAPAVAIVDATGSNALITATAAGGSVTSLNISSAGVNYSANATLVIGAPPSNSRETFTSANTFTGVNLLTNTGNVFNGSFGVLSGGTLTVSNNLNLAATTTAASGIIYAGSATLMHSYGTQNFFAGAGAGNLTMTGTGQNTAIGYQALKANTTGAANTAVGASALAANTTGANNTAVGGLALTANTTGANNTAIGINALVANTTGGQNTAAGNGAMHNNTIGIHNTVSGYQALVASTNGSYNVASGYQALATSTSGSNNVAIGDWALNLMTTASNNVANGHQALNLDTTGSGNTADGESALHNVTTGSNNIGLGVDSGTNLTTGSGNIEIGSAGVAGDSRVIRLGTPGVQTNTFIAGVMFGDGSGLTNLNGAQVRSGLNNVNLALAYEAFIGGGYVNFIASNATSAAIGGGWANTIDTNAYEATVAGGWSNAVGPLAWQATIGGGWNNTIGGSAVQATIAGGTGNFIGAQQAFIGGGLQNQAFGAQSVVAGGYANATQNEFTTVGGGSGNVASGAWGVVAGGDNNAASGQYASVGGGTNNVASGYEAVVAGGFNNLANAVGASVNGGYYVSATAPAATASGGAVNTASGSASSVAGGWGNQATGAASAVGGGTNNSAAGHAAVVPGGYGNVANGDFSFAAGALASAQHSNSFVWSDGSTNTATTSTNQFLARASGGVVFYTSTNTTSGVALAAGSGSWSSLSDRNAKDEFRPVDALAVLDKVAALPLQTWHYKTQDASVRHVGPVAQDFYAAFGVGEDERHIATIDSEGVALTAIQGLNQKVDALKAELQRRDAEDADLTARLRRLEMLLGEKSR
ncbi:MAG TPA: tail fiber domain-containing protein [Verrucomicrobiae bacterium]|nr:tail fiber domain-containing protein [Verrucomicrobiae bacterium]